jgi:uncharacterized membrane protein (UPF0182 family)
MSRLWRWLKYLVLAAVGLLLLYVVLALVFMDFMVDLWWFDSLGYLNYFFLRLTYRYFILIIFSLAFFLVFFLNFWVASRFLGTSPPPADSPDMARYRYRFFFQKFRHGSLRFYALFSLILALILAWPFFQNWQETLLFLFGQAAGVNDPYYGIDVSFYLFSLPVYLSFLHILLLTLILLFLGLMLLYWLEKQYLAKQALHLPRGAKIHLSLMVFVIFVVGIWDFFLQRFSLLYTTAHETFFYGPGYVEMNVILPVIWITIFFMLTTAVLLLVYVNTRHGFKFLVASTVLLGLALVARYSPFLPNLVQKYVVKPNELSRERPYISDNIQATLAAFKLDQVEHREYKVVPWELSLKEPPLQTNLRNIPVWDQDVLLNVYQHLQELRTYYKIPDVDVGRYTVNGVYQQVFLAPRELSTADLPKGVQNWINERLKYTHGYGAVMTPAAQGGEEPMVWFIHDIPPQSDYGFKIAQPGIYFGSLDYGYVIAPNESKEFNYPTAEFDMLSNYQGNIGIFVHSLFRRLLFALYYKDKDILFTFKTTSKSRILIRRNIVKRVKTLTPFFLLDKDPYIVVTDKGIYWIQDAYTTSSYYPYAQPYEVTKVEATGLPKVKPETKEPPSKPQLERLNYIRNSVKIVVDAYDGSVDFYLADKADPIIQAYDRMYPGLLKPLADMPPDLREHIRYPKDIFDIQAEVYAKYHQIDPGVFFRQEDIWEFPEIMHDRQPERMRPYFLTLNLINEDKFEFILVSPMTPMARTNLRSLMVGGCDGENYGKIFAYEFPKGALVYGPSQIDAFIDQNTKIAEQFTLWNQLGSQVIRGRMILIPATGGVVYIQPIYLKAAAGTAIPQLQRIILNKGEVTVMEPSLEEDLAKLENRMRELSSRARQRLEGGIPKTDSQAQGTTEVPQKTPETSKPE